MEKILVINTVGFQYEGITSMILNYTKGMDREGLQFTFPVYEDTIPKLKEELEDLGRTVVVPNRKQNVKGYIKALFHLLREGFDVLHVHGNSGTMLIETVIAKLRGVKKIILHTHSTSTNHPLANALMKYPMMLLADALMACSDAAGTWLYGKKKYTVLNNAIDIEKFRFDPQNREQYREEFGISEEEFLIGHIGHFTPQKNHFFLLDIFKAYHELDTKAKLLLIGDGPNRQKVEEAAEALSLKEKVIFAGRRSDAAAIYSAMDLLLLPSRWEGLPLTMIEAQTNGLPLLVSDVITRDAKCTDRTFYKALEDGPESWAEEIPKIRNGRFDREEDMSMPVRECGFDIHKEAENLRNIYIR